MTELPEGVSFECGLQILYLMKEIKEKVEKQWNCNSEDITKSHFPEDIIEGVKCCMFFNG
jgi:hypothetical protein